MYSKLYTEEYENSFSGTVLKYCTIDIKYTNIRMSDKSLYFFREQYPIQ